MNDLNGITLMRHGSFGSVWTEYERPMREEVEKDGGDWDGGTWAGQTEDGQEVEFELADVLDQVTEQGVWGFADTNQKVLHFWMIKAVDFETLLSFFAHELSHLILDDAELSEDEGMACEQRAEIVSAIATQSFSLASRQNIPVSTTIPLQRTSTASS